MMGGLSLAMITLVFMFGVCDNESLNLKLRKEAGELATSRSLLGSLAMPTTPIFSLNANIFFNVVALGYLHYFPSSDQVINFFAILVILMSSTKVEAEAMAQLT